jgi:hypothetical protein
LRWTQRPWGHVYGYDCSFKGTDRIVRIKTARGRGGVIENLWFKDLRADTIQQEAIHLNMLYTGKELRFPAQTPNETTPRMRNIFVENISCGYGKSFGVEILGLPEMNVENVTLKNLDIRSSKGINIQDASKIMLTDVNIMANKSPIITLTDAKDVTIDSLRHPGKIFPIIKMKGDSTARIIVKRSGAWDDKKSVSRGKEVPEDALRIEP